MPKQKHVPSKSKRSSGQQEGPPRKKAKGVEIREGRRAPALVVSHPQGKGKKRVGEPPENKEDSGSIQFTSTESESEYTGGSKTPVHTPTPATTTKLASYSRRASEVRTRAAHDPLPRTPAVV